MTKPSPLLECLLLGRPPASLMCTQQTLDAATDFIMNGPSSGSELLETMLERVRCRECGGVQCSDTCPVRIAELAQRS